MHVLSHKKDLEAFVDAHPLHRLYGGEHAYLLGEYLDGIGAAGLTVVASLNSHASDINLFPLSRVELKQIWARRLKIVPARLIPDWLLVRVGERSRIPGRLYTFVAIKEFSRSA